MFFAKSKQSARLAAATRGLFALALATSAAAQDIPPQDRPDDIELDQVGNEGTGVFHLNQSGADASNQENILAAATTEKSGASLADAVSAQSSADLSISALLSSATMTDVANGATGVVGINQSASPASSQANLVALAVTDSPASFARASATSSTSSTRSSATARGGISDVTMLDVGNGFSGILQANQLAGTGGSQSNVVAVASAGSGIALADAQSLTARSGAGAGGGSADDDDFIAGSLGTADLRDSFNGAIGLVQVNQATGGGNSQTNLIAAAFGSVAHASALSDSSLSDVRSPIASEQELDPDAGMPAGAEGSFDGFVGVGQVSQVAGYGNQTANTISVSVSHGATGF